MLDKDKTLIHPSDQIIRLTLLSNAFVSILIVLYMYVLYLFIYDFNLLNYESFNMPHKRNCVKRYRIEKRCNEETSFV